MDSGAVPDGSTYRKDSMYIVFDGEDVHPRILAAFEDRDTAEDFIDMAGEITNTEFMDVEQVTLYKDDVVQAISDIYD
jgi:hypothetical protein